MTRSAESGADSVEIFEVGPRDGLQNEDALIPLESKVALIDALSEVGFRRIEAGAFVRADRVPQMANSSEVFDRIKRGAGVRYAALVPNRKGLAAAKAARVDEIAVFGAASEGFSKSNLGMGIADSLDHFRAVTKAAGEIGLPVRGYISCIAECPFDGPVAPDAVVSVMDALLDMGCYEISLGDTLGRATQQSIGAILDAALGSAPAAKLACHFHDTGGVALANVDVALSAGLRVFDASIGGLGGCPYAPGAPGNVGTGQLHDHLCAKGYETGLDRDALDRAETLAARIVEESRNVQHY